MHQRLSAIEQSLTGLEQSSPAPSLNILKGILSTALEQCFGSWRYHQRRSTGQKTTPASSVLRGAVQLVASTATDLHALTARDLAQVSHEQWRLIRSQLEPTRQKRLQQRRFRRDPEA